jgi:hypothetical protein
MTWKDPHWRAPRKPGEKMPRFERTVKKPGDVTLDHRRVLVRAA